MHLFTYGTLCPNHSNHHIMAPINNATWQKASVRGHYLADGNVGSSKGYPAIILDDDGDVVCGWVCSSPDLPNHWQRLDVFEGDGYKRVQTIAMLETGKTVKAFVYELNSELDADF